MPIQNHLYGVPVFSDGDIANFIKDSTHVHTYVGEEKTCSWCYLGRLLKPLYDQIPISAENARMTDGGLA